MTGQAGRVEYGAGRQGGSSTGADDGGWQLGSSGSADDGGRQAGSSTGADGVRRPASSSTGAPVAAVRSFLLCPTPESWLECALDRLPILLIDHANCEKKAAGTALALIYRYVDKPKLLHQLSRLAREELLHFEQVLGLMARLGVTYTHLAPGRYAKTLRQLVSTREPQRLVDGLLVGAVIEARSCERFHSLCQAAAGELGAFYARLLASEARHFQDYLGLAQHYAASPVDSRLERILATEAALVTQPDKEFRFHSGPPN